MLRNLNLLFILGDDETVFFAKCGQIIAYIDSVKEEYYVLMIY